MTHQQTLADVLAAHAVSVPDRQQQLLERYCELLWDWNSRLNLTRHTSFECFVTRDLHDSRQLLDQLQPPEAVLDVGAGGGVPGIVLAVLNSDLTVSLSESTGRKAAALAAMTEDLGLSVDVFAERAEDVLTYQSFDTITARAVAPLKRLIPWFRPRRRNLGRMLLVKGPNWESEYADASREGLLSRISIDVLAEYGTVGRQGKSVILELRFS